MSMKKTKLDAMPEVSKDVSDFAQKSVDQAQAAFERASEVAHGNVQAFDAAAGAFKSRSLDIQLKAMEIAQTNVNAAFAFFRKALAVKDPSELFSLNQDFVREQFTAFSKQASEINELSLLLAKETAKPVQTGVMKGFGDFAKSFAA